MDVAAKTFTKFKQTSLFNILLFLFSPLLSLPFLFLGIYKQNKVSLILLLVFAALITYQLVPGESKDLYQFYRFYNHSLNFSFSEFIDVLFNKPDFVVYTGIYIFACLGLSGQLLFSIFTFITLYLIYNVYYKFVQDKNISSSFYLLGIIIIFMSFELLGLYSGIRNLLGAAITINAFYIGHFEKRKLVGFLLLLLAILTHFSMVLFVPIYLFGVIWPLSRKFGLSIYLISFFFLFISKQNLFDFAMLLPLPESYGAKLEPYLLGLDFLEKGFVESKSVKVSFLIRISWIYFAHAYILLTYNRKSPYRFIVILLLCLLNFFSMTSDILIRLTYFIQPMFIYLMFYEFKYKYNKWLIVFFFLLIIPSFIVNLLVYREYFIDSLFNINFLTLFGILLKSVVLEFSW